MIDATVKPSSPQGHQALGSRSAAQAQAGSSSKIGAKEKDSLKGTEFLNLVFNLIDKKKSQKTSVETPTKPNLGKPKMLSPRELTFALEIIMGKLLNQSLATDQQDSLYHKAQSQSLHKKIDAAIKKVADSIAQSHVLNVVMQVLGWVATVLAISVSVALAVVSLGTQSYLVAASLMIGVAISIAVLALSQTGELSNLTESLQTMISDDLIADGVNKKSAKLVGLILANIIVTGTIMAVQLATSIMSLASGALKIGAKVAQLVNKIIKDMLKFAIWSSRVGVASQAAVTMGGAGVGFYAAYVDQDKGKAQGKTAALRAVTKHLEKLQAADERFIKELIKTIGNNFKTVSTLESSRHYVADQVAQNTSA